MSDIPLLKRLSISILDFEQALTFVKLLLDQGVSSKTDMLEAVELATIVSYSRPFKKSWSEEKAPVRKLLELKDIWPDLDGELKAVHDRIIDRRDKEMAHSDAESYSISFHVTTFGTIGSMSRDPFAPMPRTDVMALEKLCLGMRSRCLNMRIELSKGMNPGKY